MPLYEYQCDSCGARFELIRKFSDPPVTVCPKCGKETVQKLVSSPAFQFKGSGWYVTDYAKKSDDSSSHGSASKSSSEARSDTKSEAKASEAGESKADSKPDTAKDSKPAADKPAATPAAPASAKDKS